MPDPIMYQEDMFVWLAPGEPEVFLTPAELQAKLEAILADQADLPRDLQKFSTLSAQASHLMQTACELTLKPGETLQWYAVRLEK
ncbi:chlororespiratory reduction protein 7 [Almyronema epifaneia]|uniref:Chlororespiratory reduction protein 7 n=1 Tax=Almyronema epifaneia S1 TaxID=2991925 RepID=A0ABW6IC85_9CYAN